MIIKKEVGGKRILGIYKKNKDNFPLISIITVVYNNKKYLQKSINSVLKQTYKNYELIIIDGHSNDGTLEILKKNNNKIDLWISEKDKGIYDAMNKGIKFARGSILAILNSDDIYYKKALSIAVKYFKKYPSIDFLFGTVFKHKLMHGFNPKNIKWSFGIYTTHSVGFFIRASSQQKVGFYNIKYKYSSDYDLFYRMIVKNKMKGIASKKNEIFGRFRRGGVGSKLFFLDWINELYQIRVDNGQNRFFVLFLMFLKIIKFYLKKLVRI